MVGAEILNGLDLSPRHFIGKKFERLALGAMRELEGGAVPFGRQTFSDDDRGQGFIVGGRNPAAEGKGDRNAVSHDDLPDRWAGDRARPDVESCSFHYSEKAKARRNGRAFEVESSSRRVKRRGIIRRRSRPRHHLLPCRLPERRAVPPRRHWRPRPHLHPRCRASACRRESSHCPRGAAPLRGPCRPF